MTENITSTVNGCFPKVTDTWRSFFGPFNKVNQVSPGDPLPSKEYKFIVIDSKVKIRVVHLNPEKVRHSMYNNDEISSKRSSLTGEYWFEKNRPMRNTHCSCSFRRSRISITSSCITSQRDIKSNIPELVPHLFHSVETFIENLIKETLTEAFQEYSKKHNQEGGVDNYAYETSEDDVECIMRKKGKCDESYNRIFLQSSLNISHKNCVHKKHKPLIMFIHGLGSSAEVWSILMHSFSMKGFEVVAPDIIGHGFSSAPTKAGCYQFKNLLLQLITVFDYFMEKEEKRKCVLIGHSYGCSLITALYPHKATKIAQLVLISGGGPTPLAPPADINNISPYGCASFFCYPFLYCGVKRSFFYSSRGKHLRPCEDETTVPPQIMDFLIQGQCWPEGDAAFHRRIMAPTLLVYGLQDKNVTLVQECEMERTIPRAYLELLPNASHMSMIEAPEPLIHMIMCFLDMWSSN
ncbi:hypothetical protein GWI33_017453 [Rhynchophorus ferrugineus]|uniref:acylglycerol lipase n=1 Tax=Rhynchophorus ferrugineus TaxID=354439 RepID=A0A834M3V2_RHYFE|nr:hypothetical protein GWI33_017453 [Rhynchophorus ferrugineus]